MTLSQRTPVRKKAKQIAKLLRQETPDYNYLRELFRHLRKELSVDVIHKPKKLPSIPTEEEVQKYCFKVMFNIFCIIFNQDRKSVV